MKFLVYEEGEYKSTRREVIVAQCESPRAEAAAIFCASRAKHMHKFDSANVIVEPVDDEANAIRDWKFIGGRKYVCIRVTPKIHVVWCATQVHGFNPYGREGVSHGTVDHGESTSLGSEF